jgi:hypothetical protein
MSLGWYLAIDVETTGQGLRANFMTCLGAALVDVAAGTVVARYKSYVAQPPGRVWERRCVDEFWSKFPALWETTKAEVWVARGGDVVAAEFKSWVRDNVVDPARTTVVFDTAGFDQSWVDELLGDTSCLYLLGEYRSTRDLSSFCLGMGLSPFCDDAPSSKGAAAAKWGFAFPEWGATHGVTHDHDPSNDAAVIGLNAAFASRMAHKAAAGRVGHA